MAVYAICPHCGKNIALATELIESGSCPICEGALNTELLRLKNSYINTEEANFSFETGKQYFDNNDFRSAAEHFKKSLEYNQNHYLSFYYIGLCNIYENEKNPQFDRSLSLMQLLKYSLLKLDNAQVDMQHKIPFVRSVANEINIMLAGEYHKYKNEFFENPVSRVPRHKLIMLARYVSSFLTMGKDLMLIFDQGTADVILSIVEVAIEACVTATESRMISDIAVSVPLDEEYELAKKVYTTLVQFTASVKPHYSPDNHRPDFSQNILFNKEALTHIKKYYESIGQKNRASNLSVPGEILTQLNRHCMAAISFTYHSLFRSVYSKKSDPLRVDMLVQGIAFCFEILQPRVHIDGIKRIFFSCPGRYKQKEVTRFLSDFLQELELSGRKYASEGLTQFYAKVREICIHYYGAFTKSYQKTINRIKAQKGKEFSYYLDFLLNVVHASALALTDTVPCKLGKKKDRVEILRKGKEAAEEFMLMHDYNIPEIEKNPMFADVIRIWNLYDADIIINLK